MSANPAQSNPPTGATEHSLAPSDGWAAELQKRLVAIEDEQQTAEDHCEDKNWKKADYYLQRMIHEAEKLRLHLKASPPNNKVSRPADGKEK